MIPPPVFPMYKITSNILSFSFLGFSFIQLSLDLALFKALSPYISFVLDYILSCSWVLLFIQLRDGLDLALDWMVQGLLCKLYNTACLTSSPTLPITFD